MSIGNDIAELAEVIRRDSPPPRPGTWANEDGVWVKRDARGNVLLVCSGPAYEALSKRANDPAMPTEQRFFYGPSLASMFPKEPWEPLALPPIRMVHALLEGFRMGVRFHRHCAAVPLFPVRRVRAISGEPIE